MCGGRAGDRARPGVTWGEGMTGLGKQDRVGEGKTGRVWQDIAVRAGKDRTGQGGIGWDRG